MTNIIRQSYRKTKSFISQFVKILKEHTNWSPNTAYAVIGKLINKGAIERYGSNFSCKALISKEREWKDILAQIDKGELFWED
jgi:predicted transcriptional regulator